MSYNETLERQYLRSIIPQQGEVEWIGIRPKRLSKVHSVDEVQANPETGLERDPMEQHPRKTVLLGSRSWFGDSFPCSWIPFFAGAHLNTLK